MRRLVPGRSRLRRARPHAPRCAHCALAGACDCAEAGQAPLGWVLGTSSLGVACGGLVGERSAVRRAPRRPPRTRRDPGSREALQSRHREVAAGACRPTTVPPMLTDDPLGAVCDALDHEAAGGDVATRAALLGWTRATLSQWSAGLLPADVAAARIRLLGRVQGVVSLRRSTTHQPNGEVVSTPTREYSPACAPTSS